MVGGFVCACGAAGAAVCVFPAVVERSAFAFPSALLCGRAGALVARQYGVFNAGGGQETFKMQRESVARTYRSRLRLSHINKTRRSRGFTAQLPIALHYIDVQRTAFTTIAASTHLIGVAASGISTRSRSALLRTAGAASGKGKNTVVIRVDGSVGARLATKAERGCTDSGAHPKSTAFERPLPEVAGDTARGSGRIGVVGAYAVTAEHIVVERHPACRNVAWRCGGVGVAVLRRVGDDGGQLLQCGVEVWAINCFRE